MHKTLTMRRSKQFKFFLAFIGITHLAFTQNFQGVATYKTHRAFDIKLDSTKMNNDMEKRVLAMMKKQFRKTYTLSFNKSESLYKQVAELSKPQAGLGDISISGFGSGNNDALYKNAKTQQFTYQKETFGKVFLIQDTLQAIKWKLGSETKFIGEYQCYKATYTKDVKKPKTFSKSASNLKVKDNDTLKANEETITRTITAWYTPQIPVNSGPNKYQGLPGLILEIHDGKLTIICNKLVINPEEKITISAPTKGKKVNQESYNIIMEKKRKEMMERFAPRKGSEKGKQINIVIEG